jgi:4-oxalocrotonate tautomerase
MPLARRDIPKGVAPKIRVAVGDVVYAPMTATLDVPIADQLQDISEHESNHLVIDPHYLGIERTADAVGVQVTLSERRSADQKKAFYKAIAEGGARHRTIEQGAEMGWRGGIDLYALVRDSVADVDELGGHARRPS